MFVVKPVGESPFIVRGINAALAAATESTVLVGGYIYDISCGRISGMRLATDYAAEVRSIRRGVR